MSCVFLFALVNVRIGKTPGSPPSDSCFRWNETDEDALWWKTNGSVEYPVELITNDTEKNYLELVMKSASQFFGGMDQDALMGGEYGSGGFIGTTMAVSVRSSCTISLRTTRVLVRLPDYYCFSAAVLIYSFYESVSSCMRQIEQTPTKRTFAQLPVPKKHVGMPSAIPMMNIYGKKKNVM